MSLTKQTNLLLKPQCLFLLRRLSTEPTPPAPSQSPSPRPPLQDSESSSLISEAVNLLLQTPRNEWTSSSELNHLLFSSSPTPRLFLKISRHFPSSSQALTFFNYIKSNSLSQQNTKILSSTFQAIFELASREPDSYNKLCDLYKECKDQNVPLSINAATLLIRCFGKANMVDQSLLVYNELEPNIKNTHIRNVLIDVLIRDGRFDDALNVLDQMLQRESEFPPNDVTGDIVFYALMKKNRIRRNIIFRLCRNKKTGVAWDVLHDLMKLGAPIEVASCNALLSAGRVDDASVVLSKLKEAGFCPDIVCYNVLIGAFCRKKMLDKAYEMLTEMEAAGIRPDCVTYNTLISYLSKAGNFLAARRVMKEMLNDGFVPTVVTYGAIIHAYCLHGMVDEAMKIFTDMSSASKVAPNTVIYNTLIDSLCKNNQVELALSLMDDMKVKGVKPNTTTFNAMFKGLREKNMLDKALKLMDKMTEHACHPDYVSMEILTEWFSAVGETEKLRKFVQGYEVSAAPA
ncbi:hypothetical protein Pint_00496 [Pistacia integerrima]|uniref:Uncharacterized protein n=1 Tax=Pistacia integerrima TaxID=434235 RepID=A0ACC0ZG76_9ROSI|nr:hypothetical protein Pint_00496 [Pistacia integerrima]